MPTQTKTEGYGNTFSTCTNTRQDHGPVLDNHLHTHQSAVFSVVTFLENTIGAATPTEL